MSLITGKPPKREPIAWTWKRKPTPERHRRRQLMARTQWFMMLEEVSFVNRS